ncbi:MAG: hypothetical protein HOC70_03530 [Gammaproteobacteria bacterium]|nr:hypothetical protein [Gammaproteobacteria bacterium]MBT4492289.1 hypothetical protein [Gammaproteobacteria bacterium]
MKRIILCTLLISAASHSIAAKDNNSFLNGKPFDFLSDQIEQNRAAIEENADRLDVAEALITDLNTDLDTIEQQVSANSSSISDAFDDIAAANGDISQLSLGLSSLEQSVNTSLMDLNAALGTLEDDLADLSTQLSILSSDVTTANASLQAAIDTNSDDILALSGVVTTMSANLSTLQTSYLLLSGRVASTESAIAANQTSLTSLSGLVSALDVRVSALENGDTSGAVRQFELVDHHTSDDFTNQDVIDGMLSLSYQPGEFIHVKGDGANGIHEVCTDATEVSDLINAFTTGNYYNIYTSGYGRLNNGAWEPSSSVYLLSRNVTGSYGWQIYFIVWGLSSSPGYSLIGTAADNTYISTNFESFVYNYSYSQTQTLTYTVAPTRLEACGF